MLFVQIIGRGLRTAPGKADCLILDHSDDHSRLGFVTDIHHDALDDGKIRISSADRERRGAVPKECPKCTYLKPAGVHVCPNCGFAPQKQSTIQPIDGELVELRGGVRGVDGRIVKFPEFSDAELFAQLRAFARERGFKEGWAAHKFKELRGSFPPYALRYAPEIEPTPQVRSWIKSRNIAYRKATAGGRRYG